MFAQLMNTHELHYSMMQFLIIYIMHASVPNLSQLFTDLNLC